MPRGRPPKDPNAPKKEVKTRKPRQVAEQTSSPSQPRIVDLEKQIRDLKKTRGELKKDGNDTVIQVINDSIKKLQSIVDSGGVSHTKPLEYKISVEFTADSSTDLRIIKAAIEESVKSTATDAEKISVYVDVDDSTETKEVKTRKPRKSKEEKEQEPKKTPGKRGRKKKTEESEEKIVDVKRPVGMAASSGPELEEDDDDEEDTHYESDDDDDDDDDTTSSSDSDDEEDDDSSDDDDDDDDKSSDDDDDDDEDDLESDDEEDDDDDDDDDDGPSRPTRPGRGRQFTR